MNEPNSEQNDFVQGMRRADLTISKAASSIHDRHIVAVGKRSVRLWHVSFFFFFLIGFLSAVSVFSDFFTSFRAADIRQIENTAQLSFKNLVGALQPTVTSNRVVTAIQEDAPACVPGGPCPLGSCAGTYVCSNNQRVCQDVPGDNCPAPACTPGGNCTVNNCPGRFICQNNGQKVCQDVAGDNCPSAGGGSAVVISLEAESARLSGAMTTRNDAQASGGEYIIYNRQRPKDPYAQADFTFNAPKAGDYVYWGLTLAPDGLTDSFAVQVDGNPRDPFIWYTKPVSPAWRWRQMTKRDGTRDIAFIIRLSQGTHKLSLVGREETGLDKLVITNDLSYRP